MASSFFVIDIPEEEARYWTYKLEQINALGPDNEVGTVFTVWKWKLLSCVQLFVTPWTLQSTEFSTPEYRSG